MSFVPTYKYIYLNISAYNLSYYPTLQFNRKIACYQRISWESELIGLNMILFLFYNV